MVRWLGCAVAVSLAAFVFVLAPTASRALTQEEVLSRRLDKMRQAEPKMREAEQNRQEESAPPKDAAAKPRPEAEPLPIPEPVRGPVPEPKADLWKSPPASGAPPQPPTVAPAGKRDPKTAAALAVKAAKAVKARDYPTALARLNEAVAADPEDPELYNNRGNVYLNSDKPRKALADYDRAIAMKASDPTFHTNRGLAHEKLGNLDQACADYQSACDLGDCAFFKSFKEEGHCR